MYTILLLLNDSIQGKSISIIFKVKDSSFEWCIVCLGTKLQGKFQNFGTPLILHGW